MDSLYLLGNRLLGLLPEQRIGGAALPLKIRKS
jgi:hypothetical protein